MNNLIMLDYDGTIVDSLRAFCDACVTTFRRHGFHELATCERSVELLDTNWFEALQAAGVPAKVDEELEAAFSASAYREDNEAPRPFPGMREVVERLAARNIIVVVSSVRGPDIEHVLERHRFTGVADVLGSDVETSKLRKIEMARDRHGDGLEPWYVGDTVGDVKEARAAAVGAVAVTWGWQSAERLRAASPDLLADSPEDLLRLE